MGNCISCSSSTTTVPPEVDLALSIQLIHAKVLGFLSVKDLKTCRLVSCPWNHIVTPIIHERSRFSFRIDVGTSSAFFNRNPFVSVDPAEAMHKCVSGGIEAILSRGKPPRNIQNVKFWIVNTTWPTHFPEFNNINDSILELCKYYWNSLKELEYILPVNHGDYSSCHLETLKRMLPKFTELKKLKLVMTFGHYLHLHKGLFPDEATTVEQLVLQIETNWFDVSEDHDYWNNPDLLVGRAVVIDLISKDCSRLPQAFPCLRTLVFERTAHPILVGFFRTAILENEVNRPGLNHLTTIEIRSDFESWNISPVLNLQFWNLTGLSIGFTEKLIIKQQNDDWYELIKAYEDLLWSQKSTLTNFTLRTASVTEDDFHGTFMSTDLTIPIMPRLKTLNLIHKLSSRNSGPLRCNFNFKFPTVDGPCREVSGTYFDYSSQFPELNKFSFKAYSPNPRDLEFKQTSRSAFQQIRPALDMLLPTNQLHLVKCTTLRYIDADFEIAVLMEYFGNVVNFFPNVHNPIFNAIRAKKPL